MFTPKINRIIGIILLTVNPVFLVWFIWYSSTLGDFLHSFYFWQFIILSIGGVIAGTFFVRSSKYKWMES